MQHILQAFKVKCQRSRSQHGNVVLSLLGLGATYDVHLRLIGKLVGDFLLVIIELFSPGAFVLSQYTRLTDRRTDKTESRQQYRAYASQSHGKDVLIRVLS